MFRSRLRFPLAAATAIGVALCIAGPASAHIHTDPEEVEAGTSNTVGFVIEHGCDGSPTTKVEMQFPKDVSEISAVDQAGFTAAVSGQVVTFSGGNLPDGTEQAFEVTFTAPVPTGTIDIPLIQTCVEGSNDWIEPEVEGQPEPEYPAPQLVITTNPNDIVTSTTAVASTTTSTEAPATSTTAAPETTTTTEAPAVVVEEEDDDSSNAPLLIIGAIVAVAAAGAIIYLLTRKSKDGEAGTDGTDVDGAGPTDPTNPGGGTPTA